MTDDSASAIHLHRKKTRKVIAGTLAIGGDSPVSIQSMLNVPTEDTAAAISQIENLKKAGADLVRLTLRTMEAVPSLRVIVSESAIPLCADIHFNHKLALAAIEAGISKIRLNPGNIPDPSHVRDVVIAASERGVPIRIGVNGGSIDKKKYTAPTPEALYDSALNHVRILEDLNFSNIVVSIKSSDPAATIEANIIFSSKMDYPLHLGLTEAGYGLSCVVQSSAVIGHLLYSGIGDTIRVSMTGDPTGEIPIARKILETTGHRKAQFRLICCPTCGRTSKAIDLLSIAKQVETIAENELVPFLEEKGISLTAAVMGCEVNGPGEASHADAGIAGTQSGKMILFARGEKIDIVDNDRAAVLLVRKLIGIAENA
jgi:(E)-4-hydroxy-3-methylbut-2-enyl-diphosphate synthase